MAAEVRRRTRYAQVVELHQDGHSLQAIARLSGLARNTVRRYLQSASYPEPAPRRRRVQACDSFAAYLQQRWAAGQRNSAVLLHELRAQGFTDSASTVRNYHMPWRPPDPRHPGCRRHGWHPTDESTGNAVGAGGTGGTGGISQRRTFSPRQTRWVLLSPLEELDPAQRAYRDVLRQQSPPIATAQMLVEAFWGLLRHGTAPVPADQPGHQDHSDQSDHRLACSDLDTWLVAATASALPELVSFANGIRRDYDAVAAAFRLPWNQGQTEGQVNRLKLLKRQSYGRASLDLLRLRVLYRSA